MVNILIMRLRALFTKGLHVYKCANLISPLKQMCKLIYLECTLRIATFNKQDSTHCRFSSFPLTNMQHGAFLPECAKYREEKMQIHLFSTSNQIYWAWERCQWLCLCLNLIPLKRRCSSAQSCAQTAAVIRVRRRHWRNERMRRGHIFTTRVNIFGRRKINPYRLSSDAVLELLDELRADLEPRMRHSRLLSAGSEVIYDL